MRHFLPSSNFKENQMILTTTSHIEGQKISKYFGIVSGETILGANVFRDIGASWRNFVGGRAKAYEASLREAKELAINDIMAQANSLGANAIIGMRLDYETVGTGMLMVTVSGTAVLIE